MSDTPSNPREVSSNDFPHSGNKQDQLRFLLNYAVLAPSHMNTQPWKFKLNDTSIDVLLDKSKALKYIDPKYREMIISCGAAIHHIEIAANFFGLSPSIKFNQDYGQELIAQVHFAQNHEPSLEDIRLFGAIKHRQTNRRWFANEEPSQSVLEKCQALCQKHNIEFTVFKDGRYKSEFAALTAMAVRTQFSEPWYRLELANQIKSRFSKRKDGMSGFGFSATKLPTPLSRVVNKVFDKGRKIADFNKMKILRGSPVIGVMSSFSDSQTDWINTGRALSAVMLNLTSYGFSASFVNQAIQVDELREHLAKMINMSSHPQLVLRIGKAPTVVESSRYNIDDCLV
jgi:hypothetical protein